MYPASAGCDRAIPKVAVRLQKPSGNSAITPAWTLAGGQVILDLRVLWLSGVWESAHQSYLTSKPLPVTHLEMVKGPQPG